MRFSVLKYSSASAKARVLFRKLLTKDDYMELLTKKSVPEVASYLKKNTVYKDLLSDINEDRVHRGELEKLFKTSLYGDFIKMLRFMRGKPRKFLEAAFLRHEVEDLKTLLGVVHTGRNAGIFEDPESLIFLRKYSRLRYENLAKSRSIAELIENLKGSDYYKVLLPFLDGRERPKLFDMEMSLDLHFFMMILKQADTLLSGGDRQSVTRSLGAEIDIMNILMIYRCKKLFNLPKAEIIKYVIPHWYRLTREQLVGLSESRDAEEFTEMVSKTVYAEVFRKDEEHLWETYASDYMYRMYKNHLRRDYFNFGATMAYLHLKGMDIKNIITLIEGIRYSLPADEIKSYLVGIRK